MIRLRVLMLAVTVAVTALLSACGSGGAGQVSNSTCPDQPGAGGASPYYDEPGTNGTPVGQQIPQMPHNHVAPPAKVQYEHNPPTSGCHYSLSGQAPISAGVYAGHIDAEYWVHNLEHGYIAVLYNCGDGNGPQACTADFAKLRQWAATQGNDPGLVAAVGDAQAYAKVIVLPWKFDHKFAAVSWDWYDPMDTLDTSPGGELQKFYNNHVSHAPEGTNTQ